MRVREVAHGAVTVVNALAIGKGAAIGINLKTEVEIEVIDERSLEADIYVRGVKVKCDLNLLKSLINFIFNKFNVSFGLKIIVKSEIPIGVGLKSSSAFANALTKALLKIIKHNVNKLEIVKIASKVSKMSGVSITGAFDDGCASMLGGLCITDNIEMRLIKRMKLDDSMHCILYVPKFSLPTKYFTKVDFTTIKPVIEEAFKLSLKGEWKRAMIINGLAYSSFLGYDIEPVFKALQAGAISVGLSGTGPSIAALTYDPESILRIWEDYDAELIICKVR